MTKSADGAPGDEIIDRLPLGAQRTPYYVLIFAYYVHSHLQLHFPAYKPSKVKCSTREGGVGAGELEGGETLL